MHISCEATPPACCLDKQPFPLVLPGGNRATLALGLQGPPGSVQRGGGSHLRCLFHCGMELRNLPWFLVILIVPIGPGFTPGP